MPSYTIQAPWWIDEFQLVELDEIMRQRDDTTFAEMCRVRTDDCTPKDLDTLKSRAITVDTVFLLKIRHNNIALASPNFRG